MKRTTLALMVVAASIAGCQRTADIQEAPAFSMSPLVIDAAIQHRDWEPSVVEYPNGAVVAGPTLYPYETERTAPNWQQSLFAPLLFIGQTVAVPFHAVQTPPWSEVTYEGVDFEPTYTAVPPLPPSDPEVLAAIQDRPAAARAQQPSVTPTAAPAPTPDRVESIDQTVEQLTEPKPEPAIEPATPQDTPAPATPPADQPAVQVVRPPAAQPAQTPTTQPATRPIEKELNK